MIMFSTVNITYSGKNDGYLLSKASMLELMMRRPYPVQEKLLQRGKVELTYVYLQRRSRCACRDIPSRKK